ncbi:lsu ribosomal protein l17e (l22p) [hydrocarbon metagenome]|uniref:Lsu ribosomal protein l17e (L22p) n=1 Tax=hydrocarbon metagenome TaxID=938273 RepID=A0A0W8FJB3_9ZZZZ|nr:50S ribosomal protein L22 [Methanomicrobiaceae archaeon]
MARTDYAIRPEGGNTARAKANELPVSPKHSIEIARFIRNKTTTEAIEYLNDVIALKKAIPFRRFNRNAAHRRGLSGWDAGRYPVKAAEAFVLLLRSVEENAEYIGLDTENLRIIHAAANGGRMHRAFFPRAMGRATPKRRETVNIEVIVEEVA